jgi:hypothetical protein
MTAQPFLRDIAQGHGRLGTFEPGFGVTIADAVEASCSAHPFFLKKAVTTHLGENIELIDGGYCANNPTLYALADAVAALKVPRDDIRVVSVGVGAYPEPKRSKFSKEYWLKKYLLSVQLLQKTLEGVYPRDRPPWSRAEARRAGGDNNPIGTVQSSVSHLQRLGADHRVF